MTLALGFMLILVLWVLNSYIPPAFSVGTLIMYVNIIVIALWIISLIVFLVSGLSGFRMPIMRPDH